MLSQLNRAIVVLVFLGSVLQASTVPIGVLSFDTLIPGAPGSPGVSQFTIANLTGDPATGGFALPPDFPMLLPVVFSLSSLTLTGSGGTRTILLGAIAAGVLAPPPDLQFPDTEKFYSATFSATLSETVLVLSNGTVFLAAPSVQGILLPSSGGLLTAGTDYALISAVANIPEPASWMLIAAGLLAIAGGYRYMRRKGAVREDRQ